MVGAVCGWQALFVVESRDEMYGRGLWKFLAIRGWKMLWVEFSINNEEGPLGSERVRYGEANRLMAMNILLLEKIFRSLSHGRSGF